MCPTLLLIEPNEFLRLGVTAACESHPMRLLRATESIADGIRLAGELHPDVIVVGVSSPQEDTHKRSDKLRSVAPDSKLLLWSDQSEEASYQSMLSTGWSGWVQRSLDVDDFMFSVRAIASGRHLFIHEADKVPVTPHLNQRSPDTVLNEAASSLSEREREVLAKLALGCTNKEIAEQIFLSVKTIETYRSRLMKKLGLSSRSDLVRWVRANNLTDCADAG